MADIHICSLSKLAQTIERTAARHVASLINAGMPVAYPLSVPVENRLRLNFNDIQHLVPGLVAPEKIHVEKFLAFLHQWDRQNPLVIHCWMGVSRSTAGGYIAQCALMPDTDETSLAKALRAASAEATPNLRLVQFADDILQRKGRMVQAIAAIGRGIETDEGVPFSLTIKPDTV